MTATFDDDTAIQAGAIQPGSREAKMRAQVQRWHRRFLDAKDFEDKYRPPQNLLSKTQKDDIKIYHSLKQGRVGTRVLCGFCGIEFAILDAEIHHRDHSRFNNQLPNLEPACRPDNENDRAVFMSESRRRSDRDSRSVYTLKKENENQNAGLTSEQVQQLQLLKQAPTTFQKSVQYKQQTLAYMVEFVKEAIELEQLAWDIVALTGCSYAKAVEYINSYSRSSRSPFRWWESNGTIYIAPREWVGTDPYTQAMNQALEQVEHRRQELARPVCINCSKHYDPTEPGTSCRTCAKCMSRPPREPAT